MVFFVVRLSYITFASLLIYASKSTTLREQGRVKSVKLNPLALIFYVFAVFSDSRMKINRPLRRIALYGNVYQTTKNKFVAAVIDTLQSIGVEIYVEEAFSRFVRLELGLCVSPRCCVFNDISEVGADMAISIGGDGTFLGTAASVGETGIPILGVNTGHLGFLADVSPDEISDTLRSLCAGDYAIEERSLLAVDIDGLPAGEKPFALNEAAVLKHDNSSLIEIATSINGSLLTNYVADGLIVATPTGSTGYSLSVGGPILSPVSGTFCLSPVAPHSLTVRPVVVRDDVEILLKIRSRTNSFLLSVDGRSRSLPVESEITLRKANHTIKVVKTCHRDFFSTLRDKMMWGADGRFREEA